MTSTMERKAFLEKLLTVEPAMSPHRLIPVLTHLWFTGKELMAYNDDISISTPLETDFTGAVPGSTLIALMKSSMAKKVEFISSDGELEIEASRSHLKLALMPEDAFCFDMPGSAGKAKQLVIDFPKFLEWIELCLRSAGRDATVPQQLGVTLQARDGYLYMNSTNDATISSARMPTNQKMPFKERAILATKFCEEMIRLCRGHKEPILEIHDEYSLLTAEPNILFGRLVEPEKNKLVQFQEMLEHHFPDKRRKNLVPIPKKLAGILDRAIIITDSAVERNYSIISVNKGEMEFFSKSERGEISDTIEVGDNHPDVEVNIEPKLLKAALSDYENMLMTDECAILERKDAVYVVASRPSQD